MMVEIKNTRCDVTHITELERLMYGILSFEGYTDGRGERSHAES